MTHSDATWIIAELGGIFLLLVFVIFIQTLKL